MNVGDIENDNYELVKDYHNVENDETDANDDTDGDENDEGNIELNLKNVENRVNRNR